MKSAPGKAGERAGRKSEAEKERRHFVAWIDGSENGNGKKQVRKTEGVVC